MARILHYLNQFFAGIGGEDKAGQELLFLPKAVGPGNWLCDSLKNHGVEYATVVCGDNYFHEQEATALALLTEIIEQFERLRESLRFVTDDTVDENGETINGAGLHEAR